MMKLLCCVFVLSFALLAKGTVVEVGGLKSYVSGSLRSKRAVILASDVYGYKVPNLRAIADKIAAAGYYAVVPDFLRGDPYDPKNITRSFDDWFRSHSPVRAVEDAIPIIADLRRKGVRPIGIAGFCWGGKLAIELAKTNRTQAAVLLHPSFVTVKDTKEVKIPIAILGAEFDDALPISLLKQFEQTLTSQAKVANFVKIYRGVSHGFTLRYDLKDPKAVKAANEAHRDTIRWFNKYIKFNAKTF